MPPPSMVPRALLRAGAIAWRVLVVVALLAIAVWLAFVLATVTASILVSLIVGATFAPLTRRLRSRGWSRAKASAVVTVSAVLVAGAVIALVIFAFVPYASTIVTYLTQGAAEVKARLQESQLSPEAAAAVQNGIAVARDWVASHLADVAGNITGAVTVAILSLFLTYYVLADGDNFWNRIVQATDERHRAEVEATGWDAIERVGGYLRGTGILAGVRAIICLVLLVLFNVPLAAPLAVLVFAGGFIPYIGPLVATLAVLLTALATVGPQPTIVLFVLLGFATVLQNQLLRPVIYGHSIHLHPAVILIALPI
ncbi:MAG TPA: AI-2E family transporter, partial [Candidatus Limnocylindria bacterium]